MFGCLGRFALKLCQIRARFGHLRRQSGDDPAGGIVVVKLLRHFLRVQGHILCHLGVFEHRRIPFVPDLN